MSNKLVTSEYIYQNNASNVHSCIHGVCRYILYAFEYLTFGINGMVSYLSVCIKQNYIRTETLAVLPTGNLIFSCERVSFRYTLERRLLGLRFLGLT